MNEDLLELIESGLLEILKESEFKDKVLSEVADELPLPNFIEKRVLSLLYSVALNFVDRIYQES